MFPWKLAWWKIAERCKLYRKINISRLPPSPSSLICWLYNLKNCIFCVLIFCKLRMNFVFLFLLKCKQEKLKLFLEKRERGELLVQKTTRLFEKFLAPAQLSARNFVSFNQAIQLIACDMPKIHSTMNRPLALSVVVNEPHINFCQGIDQRCDITCAPSPRPTIRNTFIIRKPPSSMRQHRQQSNVNEAVTGNSSDCQHLKYGQDFTLECYESVTKPLMLFSSPKSIFTNSSEFEFKAHGEMKQSVGLAVQKANSSGEKPTDALIPSKFFHWRFYHINPDFRYETMGENIPVCIAATITLYHSFIMVLKLNAILGNVVNRRSFETCVRRRRAGISNWATSLSIESIFDHLVFEALSLTPMIDHST